MTLADAADDEERAEWERAPFERIEDANGQTVVACHDLSKITHANARLLVATPEMRALLDEASEDPAAFQDAQYRAAWLREARALLARIDGEEGS